MEFKKGDIVTAEFLVTDDSNKDDMRVARNSEWELVRRHLDLTKPLRFRSGPNSKILKAYPSSLPDLVIVEYQSRSSRDVSRYSVNDLENIPEEL